MAQELLILVVDDARENLSLMGAMLKRMGHRSILANGGAEGLVLFMEHQPDIVLMDVMMPKMDGYECVREIRLAAKNPVQIIYVSAMTQDEGFESGNLAGGDDYLLKPVKYELLQSKIDMLAKRDLRL
jgi:two-component system, HptB-dependent secretion and biofilm response regulator